jgi:hypothetical protein
MNKPRNIADLIERIRTSRQAWEQVIVPLNDSSLQRAGFCGEWSVKDVIAHLTWHEKEMIGLIEAHALVGSKLWNLPLDQRNAAIYEQNRQRSLEDVQQEGMQVYAQLIEQLLTLSEDDLHDPVRFPGMPPDWQPWKLIAENTYEHYEDHTQQAQTFHAQ